MRKKVVPILRWGAWRRGSCASLRTLSHQPDQPHPSRQMRLMFLAGGHLLYPRRLPAPLPAHSSRAALRLLSPPNARVSPASPLKASGPPRLTAVVPCSQTHKKGPLLIFYPPTRGG